MQYANIWNANPSKAHLECKHTQCVKPLLCTSKQCPSSVWLPRAFRGLVGATCRVRAGCGGLVVAWSRPAAQPKFFRSMLLAMSWLLTSNGQRPKLLLRLLCVPALLLPGQTPSSRPMEAGLLLRPGLLESRIFLLYVARNAFLA